MEYLRGRFRESASENIVKEFINYAICIPLFSSIFLAYLFFGLFASFLEYILFRILGAFTSILLRYVWRGGGAIDGTARYRRFDSSTEQTFLWPTYRLFRVWIGSVILYNITRRILVIDDMTSFINISSLPYELFSC